MNALVLEIAHPRNFQAAVVRHPKKVFLTEIDHDFDSGLCSEIGESFSMLSTEFPVMTIASTSSASPPFQFGFLHKLRIYSGTALIGALAAGLFFGWSDHRELAQWIGAGVAALMYTIQSTRSR